MSDINQYTGLPQDASGNMPYLQFGNQFQTSGVRDAMYVPSDYNIMNYPQNAYTQALANGTPGPGFVIPNPISPYRFGMSDGSAANPGLFFAAAADNSTGLWRVTTHDVGFSVGGSNVTEWLSGEFRINYLTLGSAIFAGANGKVTQDNANYFYDVSTHRLGIGLTDPATRLEVRDSSLNQLTLSKDDNNAVQFLCNGTGMVVSQYNNLGFAPEYDFNGDNLNGTPSLRIKNLHTSGATSHAWLVAEVGGSSAGDPVMLWDVDFTQVWAAGIDNSDSQKWKLCEGSALGTNDRITVYPTSGNIAFGTGSFFWDNTNLTLKLTGGATANPYLFIGPAGNGRTGQIVLNMTSSESSTSTFNFITAQKGNSSDPRDNVHYKLGYNISALGSVPGNIAEPSFYFAWEDFFQTGSDRVIEMYMEYLSASATPTTRRPWYCAISRLTNTVTAVDHCANLHSWFSDGPTPGTTTWMTLNSSGITLDPNASGSMQVLLNAQATPTNGQFVARANSLGAISALAYAAGNCHIGFDLDWSGSSFLARNATCARISEDGTNLNFIVYSSQTVGVAVSGALTPLAINLTSGNSTFTNQILKADGTLAAPSDSWSGQTGFGWRRFGTSSLALTNGTNDKFVILGGGFPGIQTASAGFFGWTNSADARTGTLDLVISRDAPGTLAIVNGNNAQTLRTYAGNGANLGIVTVNESLTIAASATTDSATVIPAGAVILAVAVRVTTVIPTAATFTVTAATGGNTFDTAAVSTAANSTDAGTAAGALYTSAGTKVRITPNLTPGAATGVVRLAIMYYLSTPPTS